MAHVADILKSTLPAALSVQHAARTFAPACSHNDRADFRDVSPSDARAFPQILVLSGFPSRDGVLVGSPVATRYALPARPLPVYPVRRDHWLPGH